jgi:hypothetical protein
MHTPLALHVPCVFVWPLKVTVNDLTELRCGTMAVMRRNWFGPNVTTPVSATKADVAALAVESELISARSATLKISAIDNVILRFIFFSKWNSIFVSLTPRRV